MLFSRKLINVMQVKQEKDELEMRFDRITEEVKEHAEIKNIILSERLSTLQSHLDQKVNY